jgi:hypothetical protein
MIVLSRRSVALYSRKDAKKRKEREDYCEYIKTVSALSAFLCALCENPVCTQPAQDYDDCPAFFILLCLTRAPVNSRLLALILAIPASI